MIRQVVQLRHFQYPAGCIDGHVRPARRPRPVALCQNLRQGGWH